MKSVAQTEVKLCKAGLWGRVAMIMKAKNRLHVVLRINNIYFCDAQKPLFDISGTTFVLPLRLDPAITIGSDSIIKFLSKFISPRLLIIFPIILGKH